MKKTQSISSKEYEQTIAELREDLRKKDKELDEMRRNAYLLMGEVVRVRRVCEIYGEERDENLVRAEKAERGVRNLRKWLEIKGEPDG